MFWQKSIDSFLVLLLVTVCPEIINITIYPLHWHHRMGFFLLALAAIIQIWIQQTGEIDKIEKVFEAKKIDVGGKYPRLVKGEE